MMSRALLMINPGWRAVVATNLSNTSRGALTLNKIASSAVHSCQKQILAEELSNGLSRNRGFVTSAVRLSDDKKAVDEAGAAEAKAAAEAKTVAEAEAAADAKAAAEAKTAAEAKAAEEAKEAAEAKAAAEAKVAAEA